MPKKVISEKRASKIKNDFVLGQAQPEANPDSIRWT